MWRPLISSNSSASICCTASSRCHQFQQPVMRQIPGVEKNVAVTMKASVLVRHNNKELTWLLAYLLTQWCRKQFKGEEAHFPAQSAGKKFFRCAPTLYDGRGTSLRRSGSYNMQNSMILCEGCAAALARWGEIIIHRFYILISRRHFYPKFSKSADLRRSYSVPHQCHFLELCGIAWNARAFSYIFYKCTSLYDLHRSEEISCTFKVSCLFFV